MNILKIQLTFIEPILGSLNNNAHIFSDFEKEKGRPLSAEKLAEEQAAISGEMTKEEIDDTIQKQTTVFPRHEGKCFAYDYQLRGFCKEALAVGTELAAEAMGKLSKWTIRKTVDSMLFVAERRVFFMDEQNQPITKVEQLERPLRATTMRGERVCLARSEIIPAGTSLTFTLKWLQSNNTKSTQAITYAALVWALDYGALKGFGQWRGGGYGRFSYKILETQLEKPSKKKAVEAEAEPATA